MTPSDPHAPALYDELTVHAIRALIEGKASEGQQRRAIEWIMWDASRMRDLSYRPGDQAGTAFAEGRRFVGLQIGKLLTPEALASAKRVSKAKQVEEKQNAKS